MCVGMLPCTGPPQARWTPSRSITRFIAFRTWMSSNGGVVRFMYMYQMRSPPLTRRRSRIDASVRYLRRVAPPGVS